MAKAAARPKAQPKEPKAPRPPRVRAKTNGSNGGMHTQPVWSDDDIRIRAYHRYLERGAVDGGDFDDWLAAEKELKVAHN